MAKRLKLKKFVMPTVYILLVLVFVLTNFVAFSNKKTNDLKPEEIQYVSNVILSNDVPVMSTSKVIIKPYNDESVKIGKYYYEYNDDKDSQQNSILFYENTYIQNSGVDYISDKIFDVLSVYDGIVIKVEDNEVTGKTVEIKHDNNIITVYQGLSEILVREGDSVNQSQVLGKSGISKISSSLGNHLHFEVYVNGIVINPEKSYNKKINELQK